MKNRTPDFSVYDGLLPAEVPYVMVIEGDPHLAETLQEVIKEEMNLGVIFAANAQVTLQLMAVLRPQVFVINESLPDENGINLVKQLRQLKGFEQIPVVLLSTNIALCHQRAKLPSVFCVEIPFELEDLISVVGYLFSLPQQIDISAQAM